MVEFGDSETRSSFDIDMNRMDQDGLSPLQRFFPVERIQCKPDNIFSLALFHDKIVTRWLQWYEDFQENCRIQEFGRYNTTKIRRRRDAILLRICHLYKLRLRETLFSVGIAAGLGFGQYAEGIPKCRVPGRRHEVPLEQLVGAGADQRQTGNIP